MDVMPRLQSLSGSFGPPPPAPSKGKGPPLRKGPTLPGGLGEHSPPHGCGGSYGETDNRYLLSVPGCECNRHISHTDQMRQCFHVCCYNHNYLLYNHNYYLRCLVTRWLNIYTILLENVRWNDSHCDPRNTRPRSSASSFCILRRES